MAKVNFFDELLIEKSGEKKESSLSARTAMGACGKRKPDLQGL